MRKRMFVCCFIFTMSIFHFSIPDVVFGKSIFETYESTFTRSDIQPFFPTVLRAFGKTDIQETLHQRHIMLILSNPFALVNYDSQIAPQFIGLLGIDNDLRALFADEQFYNVLKDSDELDKLVTLIEEATPSPPLPNCPEPEPKTLSIVSGHPQFDKPSTSLQPFVVGVLDQNGKPLGNISVTFRISRGWGGRERLSTNKEITNEWGQAQTILTLGSKPGQYYSVEAKVINFPKVPPRYFTAATLNPEDHSGAAPTLSVLSPTPETFQEWITLKRLKNDGSMLFQQDIANLERLFAVRVPSETRLLLNYPNPFNPETWIPYQLSEASEVTVSIYSVNGNLIRTLALGHQPAGVYQSKSRAAYWDGRNEIGERVASGVYFYTLTAGEFTATGKMLVRK